MGYSGSVIDTTAIAQNADIQTLLTRAPSAVALNSDIATLLTRVSAAVALNADIQTLLGRISANVALNSDMATLLGRVSANVALNSDMATLLGRVSANVALNSDMATLLAQPPQNFEGAARLIPSSSSSAGVVGAYVQVIASTAHTVVGLALKMRADTTMIAKKIRVVITSGGAGSEVVKVTVYLHAEEAADSVPMVIPLNPGLIGKGVRVAVGVINDTDTVANAVTVSITLLEKND